MPEPAPERTPPDACIAELAGVLEPGESHEHLKCELPAGHEGHHRDGMTTWGRAQITSMKEPSRG